MGFESKEEAEEENECPFDFKRERWMTEGWKERDTGRVHRMAERDYGWF